jgi:hypothetical protein
MGYDPDQIIEMANKMADNRPWDASILRLFAKSLTDSSVADDYAKFGWSHIKDQADHIVQEVYRNAVVSDLL